jgi:hypothetical protein
MSLDQVPPFLRESYEVREWRHAVAILAADFPEEWADIERALTEFRLYRSEILKPGGRKSGVSTRIDGSLTRLGWEEQCFETKIMVDDNVQESPTHKVDCFKNGIGLEIEWNNKDPFYDRDLNNFRLLFDLRTIHVGIIVTRSDELQDIFDHLGRGDSYGSSTTHMSKLLPRLEGGSGGGCPILVLGITKRLYVED